MSTTGVAPCELLMGRRIRTKLDRVRPDLKLKVTERQSKQKLYHDKSKDRTSRLQPGDKVYVKNFAKGPKWLPGKIEAKTGPVSYTVTINEGHTIRRHIDHVRKRTDYGEWNTSSAETPEVDHEFEPPMVSNEPEVTPSIVTPATPVK
ncbi:uncharacterized protein [Argopecten irradians]|uniref:uncharacterized protein n=1 Tax=Argopecten irradians TaxID=31199 RepID=UPI00371C834A